MSVAAYLRVSTGHQAQGNGCDAQRLAIERWATFADVEVAAWYEDLAVSGRKASRPALDAMLARARAGEHEAIVCYSLSRLGRSMTHLARLIEEASERKWRLVSVSEGLDVSTAMGRFITHLFANLAELEVETLRERTRDGMAAARARGRVPGPRIDEEAMRAAVVAVRGGMTQVEAASVYGVSRRTLQRHCARGVCCESV